MMPSQVVNLWALKSSFIAPKSSLLRPSKHAIHQLTSNPPNYLPNVSAQLTAMPSNNDSSVSPQTQNQNPKITNAGGTDETFQQELQGMSKTTLNGLEMANYTRLQRHLINGERCRRSVAKKAAAINDPVPALEREPEPTNTPSDTTTLTVTTSETPSTVQQKADMTNQASVQKIIGYNFKRIHLLAEALEAAGRAVDHDTGSVDGNKRLALVGDAVLRLILVDEWYSSKGSREGADKMLKEFASNRRLQECAEKINIVFYILPNPTRAAQKEKVPKKTSASTIEALVGAVWLDSDRNFEVAKKSARHMGILGSDPSKS
ncbi:hypothetical protein TWF506_004525 [Arthrobotrys conoides]|uniref:RNase III domain-containing protein n=1 Tax=Arthrobotrys conoides TaxID=74498 RepID=A0AAN8N2T3_9PEZI